MSKKIINLIAFVEVAIGLVTITGLAVSLALSLSTKSPNVFIFVLISATISCAIGLGLFGRRGWARSALVFFSGYIVITKLMLFAGILKLNGQMVTVIPDIIKNTVSFIYHGFMVVFFTRSAVKEYFK